MKKSVKKILIFIIICLGLIFSISFKTTNQDELQSVYKKVEKYFKSNDNSELRRNCVAFSLDKINIDINSKYIFFEQGNSAHLYYD